MKKVVVIGGGSGLSTLLRGIRDYPVDITAVVAVTDDGASSGILRQDFKMLPPGDIRKCIAALSDDESVLLNLFQYRFRNGIGLKGHSFGNLFLTALKEISGSFETAIEETSKLLNIKGRVLPATLERIGLIARFDNGREIHGESKITKYGYKHAIKSVLLNRNVKSNPEAISAIDQSDIIFVGPGSLYTSLIPNFLLKGIKKSYINSSALKVYICNVSTERGETESFTVQKHLEVLSKYGIFFDAIIINNQAFEPQRGDGYVNPVELGVIDNKVTQIFSDIVDENNYLYHSSEKLGKVAYKIVLNSKKLQKSSKITKVYQY
jgi:uncharacterized cofD-like protein